MRGLVQINVLFLPTNAPIRPAPIKHYVCIKCLGLGPLETRQPSMCRLGLGGIEVRQHGWVAGCVGLGSIELGCSSTGGWVGGWVGL